ncbi:NAD(P)-dependent oxidoreductase [Blastochloris viridis]|uniref:NAD(P)-dependent oxidoreductase n=1 Tax=Blastochloris viridis TaxID=1079 RepID=UPI0006D76DDF|nr:NAD(P)-dependent oxidoreductase [Blastochloris viridis]
MSYAVAGRRVLVAGEGEAALQKLRLLVRTEAMLTLVAAAPSPDLAAFADAHGVERTAALTPHRLAEAVLAFIALGDEKADARLAERLRSAGIAVNVVDRPHLSDFATPSIVDRAPISIAIATDGHAPVLAVKLRGMIEALLPPAFGRLGELAARVRERAIDRLPDALARRRVWSALFEGRPAALALAGDIDAAADLAVTAIDRAAVAAPTGKVWFVGAGSGVADLLTLRAHRLLLTADVVVHDGEVPEAILAMGRRDVTRVRLDRRSRAEAGALLVRLGGEGKAVVRLVTGAADATDVDRDTAALSTAGIEFEIVPGVATPRGAPARTARVAARRAA